MHERAVVDRVVEALAEVPAVPILARDVRGGVHIVARLPARLLTGDVAERFEALSGGRSVAAVVYARGGIGVRAAATAMGDWASDDLRAGDVSGNLVRLILSAAVRCGLAPVEAGSVPAGPERVAELERTVRDLRMALYAMADAEDGFREVWIAAAFEGSKVVLPLSADEQRSIADMDRANEAAPGTADSVVDAVIEAAGEAMRGLEALAAAHEADGAGKVAAPRGAGGRPAKGKR